MSFFKKLLPIAGAAVGSVFGMPQVGAALGSAVAGGLGASAQKKATTNSLNAFNTSDAAALQARDSSVAGYQPFLQGGTNAFQSAAAQIAPGSTYTSDDPGYKYLVDEMQNATQRGASAGGELGSGGFYKALQRNAAGLASQDFQNSFARKNALAQYWMQAANGDALAQSGYANLLQRSAAARNGIYTDRGNATADQYGAAADFGNALFGSNGLFGSKVGGASGGGGFGSGFDFTGGSGFGSTFAGF